MADTRDAVLKTIDFIEENLQNDISVQDTAKKAGYSIYHFIRLFEGITGHTPKDYILRRRISESCKEIFNSNRKLIEICFDYQFNSPEVFSRAFKRILGVSPREITKKQFYPEQQLLSPIDRESIAHGENVREVGVEQVNLDRIHLAGMVTLIRKDKKIISEIWNYISKDLQTLVAYDSDEYYGHSFWSDNYDLEGFFLLCGINMKNFNNLEVPFCTRIIPPNRYLKFIHKGNVERISHTYKYIFQSYLPKTDYSLSLPFDFEVYHMSPKGPHDPDNRTEILIPVG